MAAFQGKEWQELALRSWPDTGGLAVKGDILGPMQGSVGGLGGRAQQSLDVRIVRGQPQLTIPLGLQEGLGDLGKA